MTLCFSRLPEDGTAVSKHVGLIHMNCVLRLVFYRPLFNAFVGQYIEYKNMHGMYDKIPMYLVGFYLYEALSCVISSVSFHVLLAPLSIMDACLNFT